jgi:hypothetical protein
MTCSPCRPSRADHPIRSALWAPAKPCGGLLLLLIGLPRKPVPRHEQSLPAQPPGKALRRLRDRLCPREHCPRGHDAGFHTPPERHQALAGEGDHPDPADATAPSANTRLIPLGSGTLRLEPSPAPGDRQSPRSPIAVASLREPQVPAGLPTLVRGRRQPRSCADRRRGLQVPPGQALHHRQPRTSEPDPPACRPTAAAAPPGPGPLPAAVPQRGVPRDSLRFVAASLLGSFSTGYDH